MQRAGEYITNLSGEAEYKSFRPTPLPVEIDMDAETKEILFETIKIFIKSAKDTVQNSVQEKIQEYQGTLHLNP